MPKYLIEARYTQEGAKGLAKDGGTARRAAVKKMIEGLGGKLEVFYFAFGDTDVYSIVEAPDNVSIAAAVLAIGQSGAVSLKTTPLITPEEIDKATKKPVKYRPPGN